MSVWRYTEWIKHYSLMSLVTLLQPVAVATLIVSVKKGNFQMLVLNIGMCVAVGSNDFTKTINSHVP